MRKTIIVPVALAIAAATPFLLPSIAVGQDATPPTVVTVPADWLGIGVIASRLAEAGWTLAEIEAEPRDGNYEACLIGADGTQVEARIDPFSGEILSQVTKSCLDRDDDRSDDDSDDDHSDDDSDDSGSDDDRSRSD